MKALRIILPLLLILAVLGLLGYQYFVENSLETRDITRGAIIILGAICTMFKKPKQRPVANKKALYQKAYPISFRSPLPMNRNWKSGSTMPFTTLIKTSPTPPSPSWKSSGRNAATPPSSGPSPCSLPSPWTIWADMRKP